MQAFEYKVVPAPHKGTKAKGVKGPEGRFANSIEIILNEMAAEGWEYQRAELLPSDERTGLTGTTTNWRNVLIFRRILPPEEPHLTEEQVEEALAPASFDEEPTSNPAAVAVNVPAPQQAPEPVPLTATAGDPEAPAGAQPIPGPGAAKMVSDDGVEELSPVSGITAALKTRAKQKSESGE
ncbi:hypothetical protein RSK20926_15987 [Roseobacter sp. SK209-2-6]|uniref:DUF4177 domain-containing protein n=1 Tax=Roseobacter sp. SK209-2-6 TaxID=388739 RepID=UPI0000F3CFFF|nr:DUF4177 domain-containing protein [Roseobacter sp. SK209-2-6]EBA15172.1 hypothetical protein RSK20926_15987 [Roseobacter sp. SK209-2-6]